MSKEQGGIKGCEGAGRNKLKFIKKDGTIIGGWIVLLCTLDVFGIFTVAAFSSHVAKNLEGFQVQMVLAFTALIMAFFGKRVLNKRNSNGED